MNDSNFSSKRVIYPDDNGGVSIVIPAPNCGLTFQQIIDKSVPSGKPYQIVDASDIPNDRTYRNAWTYEE